MPENATSPLQIRTRGPRAFISIACSEGQQHAFTIELDGSTTNDFHSPDEDAVIVALGGQPSACGTVMRIVSIVKQIHTARTGETDMPNLRFRRRGWYVRGTEAPTGRSRHTTMAEATSVNFQLNAAGISPEYRRAANTLLRWIARNSAPAEHIYRRDQIEALGLTLPRWYTEHLVREALLTPAFITPAREIVGDKLQDIITLRDKGITVQWLTELVAHLSPRAKRRARLNTSLLAGLGGARNVNARLVARFVEHGIYSHIHTYIRASATPAQVLAVYKATNRERTLADLLDQGMTVTDAVRSVA